MRVMRNFTVRVFEHIETTSDIDYDKIINHMERILIVTVLKKYRTFM